MTPGWQTSEFWLTLIHKAVSVSVVLGVVSQVDATKQEGALVACVTAVVALLTNAHAVAHYVWGRVTLKQDAAQPA